MPTYSIAGPDGKTYSIDGPEGATREQVIAKIQSRMSSSTPAPPETKEIARGTILPLKTMQKGSYPANDPMQGQRMQLAVPQAVKDLGAAASLPGDVVTGKVNPMSEEGQDRARDFAMTMAGFQDGAPLNKKPIGKPPTDNQVLAKNLNIKTKGSIEDFQKSLLDKTEQTESKLGKSVAGGQTIPKQTADLPSEDVALNTAKGIQGGLSKLWEKAQDNYKVLSKIGSKVDVTNHPAVAPIRDFLNAKPPDVTIPGEKGMDTLLLHLGQGGEPGARKVTLADLDTFDRRLGKVEAKTKDGKTADYISELRGRIQNAIDKTSMVKDPSGKMIPGNFNYYRQFATHFYKNLKAITDGETAKSLGLDKSLQDALHRMETGGTKIDIGNAVTSTLGLERKIKTAKQIELLKTLIPNTRDFQKLMGSTVEHLAQTTYKNLDDWQVNKQIIQKIVSALPYKSPKIAEGLATLDKLYTNIQNVGGPSKLAPKEFRAIRQISNRVVDATKAAIATVGSHGVPSPYAGIKAAEAFAPSDTAKAKALETLRKQMKPKNPVTDLRNYSNGIERIPRAAVGATAGSASSSPYSPIMGDNGT